MGKASRLLTMLVDEALYESHRETFDQLKEMGHRIVRARPYDECGPVLWADVDVILSPKAWRAFDTDMLEVTIKAARKVKYG